MLKLNYFNLLIMFLKAKKRYLKNKTLDNWFCMDWLCCKAQEKGYQLFPSIPEDYIQHIN